MSEQTDSGLLELAANAAEINDLEPGALGLFRCIGEHEDGKRCLVQWNPLTNDGDALRLAVKLGMRIYIYPGQGDDFTIAATDDANPVKGWSREDHHGEPEVATRRAIVHAAAEMGRNIKKRGGTK